MKLLNVESLANPAPAVQNNFEVLDAAVFHGTPTRVAGVANTRQGPPASGIKTWMINELWVDALLSPWICVASGNPGTWLQMAPAWFTASTLPATADIDGYQMIHARNDAGYRRLYWSVSGSAWTISSLPMSGGTLTGALGVVAGSASTPGLFASGDANTGIFSPGADILALATGGSERARVNSTGLLVTGEMEAGTVKWTSSGSAPTPITAPYTNLTGYFGSNGTRWLGEPNYWVEVKVGAVVGRVPMFTV